MANGSIQDIDMTSFRPRLDLTTKLVLGVYLALMVSRFALIPSEWQIHFDNYYAELIMLGTLLLLVARRRWRTTDPGERLFLGALLIGFGAWFAISLISFSLPEWSTDNVQLFKDALLLLYSASIAIAIELRGDTYHQRLWLQHRSFYAIGSLMLVFAGFGYFAIMPLVAGSEPYQTPYGLYSAIDLYLAIRFFMAAAQASSRSWCLVYAYFGVVFLLIVLADGLSYAYRAGYLEYAPDRLLNLAWYLWYPIAFMAIAIRFNISEHLIEEMDSHYLAPATGSLLLFGLAMPLLHVMGNGLELFNPEFRLVRDIFIAVWIVFITAILYGIYYLVRTHVAKLDADREHAERKTIELEQQLEREVRLRSLSRLSAGLAHDFGNSLFAIASHAKAIETEYKNTDSIGLQGIKGINQAIQYAKELVAKLSLVGTSGRAEKIKLYDLNQEIDKTIQILAPSLNEKVLLNYKSSSRPIMVRAEKSTIHQVLSNYIYNAVDAVGQRGQVDVSVEIRPVTTLCASCRENVVGEYTVLTVHDDGPGVDSTVEANIFEPLITTKSHGLGSGLGLAMIHAIMHRIGGHVGLSSAPQTGTSFIAYFPR